MIELAFPSVELDQCSGDVYAQHPGMSLRDWFAGQALSGITQRAWGHVGNDGDIIAAWARCAYAHTVYPNTQSEGVTIYGGVAIECKPLESK